ncbi:DUF294 nucleotidyltransferase-like domain-containing protein [Ferviditalea candida]|uniref:DUF294 nucleotidyltransferase-like domain-containing protein n=1 Tax=Ferviditalea candida TaxID=3108399 RepID=A0ABU5ZEA3_9BACL|nr:DUF294 nucleotidyltransferase-like domain-containing protein [Paenibacillaceae bacterium T2]
MEFQSAALEALPASEIEPWMSKLNDVHDRVIRRAISLSERKLMDEGIGPSPCSYAFVLFGSGGRKEQTLWSDQDNGIIFGPVDPIREQEAERYFQQMGNAISEGLELAGYPPCEGKVLVSNPDWRKSVHEWEKTLDKWFSEPDWEHVRYLLIAADMRCVYGNEKLADQVRKYFFDSIYADERVITHMLHNTLRHKVTMNIFGHLVKERYGEDAGGVEIKYAAYIPMVNAVRLLSIIAGINETSTLKRLDGLFGDRRFPEDQLEQWKQAFLLILRMRMRTDSYEQNGFFVSNGMIRAEDLSKQMTNDLKFCLHSAKNLQRFVKKIVPDR